jgi:hypothetical protein
VRRAKTTFLTGKLLRSEYPVACGHCFLSVHSIIFRVDYSNIHVTRMARQLDETDDREVSWRCKSNISREKRKASLHETSFRELSSVVQGPFNPVLYNRGQIK